MTRKRSGRPDRLLQLVAALPLLSGCGIVGPEALEQERPRYNEAIEETSKEQLLTNIIRVYKNESPLSLEVGQVIASLSVGGSLSGSVAGLGIGEKSGPFRMGSLTSGTLLGALQYTESPSVLFQPITGQALVHQLTTPISVGFIADMISSGWPTPSVLQLTTNSLTLEQNNYGSAYNAMTQLSLMNAIDFYPVRSVSASLIVPKAKTDSSVPKEPPNDALGLFFTPTSEFHCSQPSDDVPPIIAQYLLWIRLLDIYSGTQAYSEHSKSGKNNFDPVAVSSKISQKFSCGMRDNEIRHDLDILSDGMPLRLDLRIHPLPVNTKSYGSNSAVNEARILSTFSAYGILKSVSPSDYTPSEILWVVPHETFERVNSHDIWNRGQEFYTFLYDDLCSTDLISIAESQRRFCRHLVEDDDHQHSKNVGVDKAIIMPRESPLLTLDMKSVRPDWESEDILNQRRRSIIVQTSRTNPGRTYASIYRSGSYYFISLDDVISQKNLSLLELIMAVEAVPPPSPVVPTIPVGG